ncbi:MAG: phosphatase PAP2 family protein [Actinomycetia bacterium]|nr:phosphatase PAP2 family protein [Actinomycetes bacterium]
MQKLARARAAVARAWSAARSAWQRRPAWLRRPPWITDELLLGVRWVALTVWAIWFAWYLWARGIPQARTDLLFCFGLGLIAWSIGRRNVLTVVIDFLPFAAVLIVYDRLRGISDSMGMPTWWHPQVDFDRWLFFGHEPTLWLQENILYPQVQWWEPFVALCYLSFFFLPYVTAAVLWLRSRADFYRWSLRFVALSFLAFGFFALTPAAPPWAAAKCTAAEIANHPYDPPCLHINPYYVPSGGILGTMHQTHLGAATRVDRIVYRALYELHLNFAGTLVKTGQASADLVAAVPSLHAGGIVLFTVFMWRRINRWWRPLLVFYCFFMGFTLVYGAEHFVFDILAGWILAVLVHLAASWIERWRKRAKQAKQAERSERARDPAPT